MDNTENRLHDVFFYGLYMDPDVLKSKGVDPRNPRTGFVNGYKLRVGKMATLLREANAVAHGIVYSLTHDEINQLYWGSGLDAYITEALLVETEAGDRLAALCCNLRVPPAENEANPEYLVKLLKCMDQYNLPVPTI